MPNLTIHEKFEPDPNYDQAKALADEIVNIRAILEKDLHCIDGIEDPTMQLICMFAMIDCLAQEQANYPQSSSKETFCQFVLKHQKQCDYLECVEPITLYYHVEDLIDDACLFPGWPPEKEINIEDFGYLQYVKVKAFLPRGESQKLLDYVSKKKSVQFVNKMEQDHKLISLIYRMRSKAVHEMTGLGERLPIREEQSPTEPYYRDVVRGYVYNGNWVTDNVVELVIPNIFIRNILADCIDGYLAECREKNRFPFSNNHITRKYKLSWYDK